MNILYFSPIPYSSLMQRPQHLAQEFAKEHSVYFVEPTESGLLRFKKSKKEISIIDIDQNLKVIQLSGKLTTYRFVEIIDIFNLNVKSEKRQLRDLIQIIDLILVGHPWCYNLIKDYNIVTIYDKMDDHININKNILYKLYFLIYEKKLINKVEAVLVTCTQFYDRIKKYRNNVYLINNATAIGTLNREYPNVIIEDLDKNLNNKKIFGYIGTIDYWFDFNVIEIILKHSSDNIILLIGDNKVKRYDHPNVLYLGVKKKELLPHYIRKFDCCLYPFKKNKLLETINPVKIYEYLAMNKPVIAVKSNETKIFSDYVKLYDDYQSLVGILNCELVEPFNKAQNRDFINKNTWESRYKDICNILQELFRRL